MHNEGNTNKLRHASGPLVVGNRPHLKVADLVVHIADVISQVTESKARRDPAASNLCLSGLSIRALNYISPH